METDDNGKSMDGAMAFLAAGGTIGSTDPDADLLEDVAARHGRDFVVDGEEGLRSIAIPSQLTKSFMAGHKGDIPEEGVEGEAVALSFGKEVSRGIREAGTITGNETRAVALGKLSVIMKDHSHPYWTAPKGSPIHGQVRALFSKAYDE